MKPGDRVETTDGPGTIILKKDHESKSFRYGVKLDVSKYDYPIAYYWPHEIKVIRK